MAYGDWDEYLIHQLPTTIDHVGDGDPNWTDRFFFGCHPLDGRLLLTTGYGVSPNQQIGAGYARLALADGRHWDVSARRNCSEDRQEAFAGPLRFTVLEPRERWRLECGPNPSGLEFDLEFQQRLPLYEFKPAFHRRHGRVVLNQQHMQQAGGYQGWIRTNEETLTVDGFHGVRDRSWGVRNHGEIDMWLWCAAQFEDRAVAAWLLENSDGHPVYVDGCLSGPDGPLSAAFVKLDHHLRFDGDLKRETGGEFVFLDEDGRRFELKAVADHPAVNVYHGAMLSPATEPVQGQQWDETDLETLRKVEARAPVSDQLMRYELDGAIGYGVLELWVSGDGYRPYEPNWPHLRQ
ncbi:MAG: hypothetical protein ACE5EF_01415 [Dehalococcoidia bacterium]